VDPGLVRRGRTEAVLFRLAGSLRSGAITVHALDGRLVRRYSSAFLTGHRIVRFDPRTADGGALPAGLYLVSLAGEFAPGPSPAGNVPPSTPVVARATLTVLP
jgi:hypothetical protein